MAPGQQSALRRCHAAMPRRFDIVNIQNHAPGASSYLFDVGGAPELLDECGFVMLARNRALNLLSEARKAVDKRCALFHQTLRIAQDASEWMLGMKRQIDHIYSIQPARRNGGTGVRRSWLPKKNPVHGKSARQVFEHGGGANGTSSDGRVRCFSRQKQHLRLTSQSVLASESAEWPAHTLLL